MRINKQSFRRLNMTIAGVLLSLFTINASAEINGITGPNFNLTASAGYIPTPDGDSLLVWGYGNGPKMQYPGPTLIVNQGDLVTISLKNDLTVPVSMIFPGQANVKKVELVAPTQNGVMTKEAMPTGKVQYQFTATHAGTYLYQSGTQQHIQIDMGLVGALIVRPAQPKQAYEHADSAFDQEYLFLLTEMDPKIHYLAEFGSAASFDNSQYQSVLWFVNGRLGPDTMSPDNRPWLPHQPYGALARTHPGDTVLFRLIGAGRELHPWHTHGNDFEVIARDGRLLQSAPGMGADLAWTDYTLQSIPGSTFDATWSWTGEKLGWDIFGTVEAGAPYHQCNGVDVATPGFDPVTKEYCPDHGKHIPVSLPQNQDMAFGGFWGGSPFLGALADLPFGEGGLNINGGMVYMWHSHTEKELVNNDIFPGGMMTMMIVEAPGVPIP